ncbi:MAG: hypothetical protein F6K09_22945 [Merismopedia sp. SIO2A8]|nr:hypothetical protein [Merismopedia sp. SIO2A8]
MYKSPRLPLSPSPQKRQEAEGRRQEAEGRKFISPSPHLPISPSPLMTTLMPLFRQPPSNSSCY